jgi:hypothetical protein
VHGELECSSRREESAVQHGEGEAAGLGHLEARSREHPQPVELDRLLTRCGIQERLSFDREQSFRPDARQPANVFRVPGRLRG